MLRSLSTLSAVAAVLAACGTDASSTSRGGGNDAVGMPSDGGASADGRASTDGNAPSDATTSPDRHGSDEASYPDGVNTCCGKGGGLTCCTAAAGLQGYEILSDGGIVKHGDHPGHTEANCFQYGGGLGACTVEGDVLERRDICSVCCLELLPIDTYCAGGPCVPGGPFAPSIKVCTRCGDGQCGLGESHGNCPQDCVR